jgi:hypothetical protein
MQVHGAAQRRRASVLVPMAAAASVVAIAVGAVVVVPRLGSTPHRPAKTDQHPGKSRHRETRVPRALAVLPKYTVLNTGGSGLQVVATATGKLLGTLRNPPKQAFATIAGAADDRTFFVTTDLSPQTSCQTYFYKFSLSADGQPSALTPLPLAHLVGLPTALAATSDGSHIVFSEDQCASGPARKISNTHVIGGIGLMDVATGKITKVWSYTLGEDYTTDLSTSANGGTLGYSNYFNAQYPVGRMLATSSPAGSDQTYARIVVSRPANTAISASGHLLYAITGTKPQVLAAYDAFGRRVSVLHQWPASATLGPLFADPAGGYALLPIKTGKTRTRVVTMNQVGINTCFLITVGKKQMCKIYIEPLTRFLSVNLTTGVVTLVPITVRMLDLHSVGWGMVAW